MQLLIWWSNITPVNVGSRLSFCIFLFLYVTHTNDEFTSLSWCRSLYVAMPGSLSLWQVYPSRTSLGGETRQMAVLPFHPIIKEPVTETATPITCMDLSENTSQPTVRMTTPGQSVLPGMQGVRGWVFLGFGEFLVLCLTMGEEDWVSELGNYENPCWYLSLLTMCLCRIVFGCSIILFWFRALNTMPAPSSLFPREEFCDKQPSISARLKYNTSRLSSL